jgi:hypothetical protein
MKKSVKTSVFAVGALALTSLFGMSAFADSRHQNDAQWRDSRRGDSYERRDDRDFLTGVVERVDHRRGVAFLRSQRGGRPIAVEMARRNSRGIDLADIRRGDRVTFVGDWTRGGVFEAWRIEDVDSGRNRGRGRR